MVQQRKKEVKVLDRILEEKRVEHAEKMDELAVRRRHILKMKEVIFTSDSSSMICSYMHCLFPAR